MASDLTPEDIRGVEFRTVRRGYDPAQVSAHLDGLVTRLSELLEEQERLTSLVGEHGDRDLDAEFQTLGQEVTAVLTTAREAADSMRERATADAARWRSEAMTEVETKRKEATNDAEALRGDAWATGTELLNQSQAEARRIRAEAERDVLTVMGEAERDAHRLTSSARREAEDLVRSAMMDAEKTASEAKKRHDELIEHAYRQTESAQERTRALEERREELMVELENVRSTLSQLESALEERREDLEQAAASPSVKVVPAPKTDPDEETWELGETVRIIPPTHERAASIPDAPGQERGVEEHEEEGVDLPSQPEIAATSPPEEPADEEAEAVPEPVPSAPLDEPELPEDEQVGGREDSEEVEALFASLRGTAGATITVHAAEPRTPTPSEERDESLLPPIPDSRNDVIESRDSRLLPITNRALRGVKKAVTDAQNLALDNLRTDPEWYPDPATLTEMIRADLVGLWAESYSAGHAAAEEMTGTRLKRGTTPSSDAAEVFGRDLAGAVSDALVESRDGQRERQSATSRVFRVWRTDEAERRVRELALLAYHRGLVDAVPDEGGVEWVPSGTPCSACRAAAAEPEATMPPVHHGCECSLALIGA